jgi:hypothetical protein
VNPRGTIRYIGSAPALAARAHAASVGKRRTRLLGRSAISHDLLSQLPL